MAQNLRQHIGFFQNRGCLSCGKTEDLKKRKYCSIDCRQRLRKKLDQRTGLLKALNVQYATFYFSNRIIYMDILPYGSIEMFRFAFPRAGGKRPAEDYSRMADKLGSVWWAEKERTNKEYLASRVVLAYAKHKGNNSKSVKPLEIVTPSVKGQSLHLLQLDKVQLHSQELNKVIKSAYRIQAKKHHPDIGGTSDKFRKIQTAYEDLLGWAKNPSFTRRRGFPYKWFYEGNKNRWIQPIPSLENWL